MLAVLGSPLSASGCGFPSKALRRNCKCWVRKEVLGQVTSAMHLSFLLTEHQKGNCSAFPIGCGKDQMGQHRLKWFWAKAGMKLGVRCSTSHLSVSELCILYSFQCYGWNCGPLFTPDLHPHTSRISLRILITKGVPLKGKKLIRHIPCRYYLGFLRGLKCVIFWCVCMYACMHVCLKVCASNQDDQGSQKRTSDSLASESLGIVTCSTWVLRTKYESSARAVCVLVSEPFFHLYSFIYQLDTPLYNLNHLEESQWGIVLMRLACRLVWGGLLTVDWCRKTHLTLFPGVQAWLVMCSGS